MASGMNLAIMQRIQVESSEILCDNLNPKKYMYLLTLTL